MHLFLHLLIFGSKQINSWRPELSCPRWSNLVPYPLDMVDTWCRQQRFCKYSIFQLKQVQPIIMDTVGINICKQTVATKTVQGVSRIWSITATLVCLENARNIANLSGDWVISQGLCNQTKWISDQEQQSCCVGSLHAVSLGVRSGTHVFSRGGAVWWWLQSFLCLVHVTHRNATEAPSLE